MTAAVTDAKTEAPAAFLPAAMTALGSLFALGYTIQTSLQPYRGGWDVHFYGPHHEAGPHGVVRVGVKSGRLLGGYVRRHGEAGPREDLPHPADLNRVISRELPPVAPLPDLHGLAGGERHSAADPQRDSRPARPGRPQLLTRQCSTCVFRPGNPMHLSPGLLAEIIRHNLAVGAALICHLTLSYGEHPELGESVCRGWYDRYRERTAAIQIFERLGGRFHLVDPIDPVPTTPDTTTWPTSSPTGTPRCSRPKT